MSTTQNWDLKEEIRAYWSLRATTFDTSFGHRIPDGPEFDAWTKAVRDRLGPKPLDLLELASGTGEVTRLLCGLGHRVVGGDFSETMIAIARTKHKRLKTSATFRLLDAEDTREADDSYDAIVCRHLVWTLTDPAAAFADWFRVLRPGGHVIVFDGDFTRKTRIGEWAAWAARHVERWTGSAPHRDPKLQETHQRITAALPFHDGLTFETLAPMMREAGFSAVTKGSHAPIARAQRRGATLRDWLWTYQTQRFILHARKP